MPKTVNDDRHARLVLAGLCEPGNAQLADLIARYGAVETLDRLCARPDHCALSRQVATRLGGDSPAERRDATLAATEDCGARVITADDPEWPIALDDLAEPIDESDPHTRAPLCLWVRGQPDLATVTSRAVSVIGARACTGYGEHLATAFGYDLAGRGWTVVSGGALGIDAAAHRGALSGEGVTIAVLAGGVDRPYPTAHRQLFDRIVESGLLISEWPPGAVPQRHRFLTRNRVIAALSAGTVVVEAGLRSGARQTARRVWELDRVLMLVPGPVTSATSAGVHQLARGPGPSRIVTRAAEVVEEVGRFGADLAPPLTAPDTVRDKLPPTAARLLDAVPAGRPVPPTALAAQAGLTEPQVRQLLPQLVDQGLVRHCATGYCLGPVR